MNNRKNFLEIKKDIEQKFLNQKDLTLIEFINSKSREIILESELFDEDYYVSTYPDVKFSKFSPLDHFLNFGVNEYCNPNNNFNTKEYLSNFMDLKHFNINPLVFYILYNFYFDYEFKELEQKFHVSIIMPTFNRKNIISTAINSVLNQTFKNFELIILDDGSDDGTDEYINNSYSNYLKSKKIKYFKLDHNGVSSARNFGLNIAKGNIIAYLDSDNQWNPNFLSVMLKELCDSKFSSAYSAVRINNHYNNTAYVLDHEFNRSRLLKRNFIDINSFIHEKKLFDEFGGFDESLSRLVDWDLIIRYTEKYPPLHVKQILVNYIINPMLNTITLSQPLDKNMKKIQEKYSI